MISNIPRDSLLRIDIPDSDLEVWCMGKCAGKSPLPANFVHFPEHLGQVVRIMESVWMPRAIVLPGEV